MDQSPQTVSLKYRCSCSRTTDTIENLFFCRSCSELKCNLCLWEEIDSIFCPSCLEVVPSSDSMIFKNRCPKCCECPSCGCTLSVAASGGDKQFHLLCKFCKWGTMEQGLISQHADDLASELLRLEREVAEDQKRFDEHAQYFAGMVEKNVPRSPNKWYSAYKSQVEIIPTRVTVETTEDMQVKKQENLPTLRKVKQQQSNNELEKISNRLKEEEKEVENMLERNDENLSSLSQRLLLSNEQCPYISQIRPRRKLLLSRRSHRCRKCEHIVNRPELLPASVRMRIQGSAYCLVPRLTLRQTSNINKLTLDGIRSDSSGNSFIVLTIKNPLPWPVIVEITAADSDAIPNCTVSMAPNADGIPALRTWLNPFRDELDEAFSDSDDENAVNNNADITELMKLEKEKGKVGSTLKIEEVESGYDGVVARKHNVVNVKLRLMPYGDSKGEKNVTVGIVLKLSWTDNSKEEHSCHFSAYLYISR